MHLSEDLRTLLDALEEPALIVQRGIMLRANGPARRMLGSVIEGTDVRLAIRHPEALEHILPGKAAAVDITGLGEFGRPWTIVVRPLALATVLVRFIDRSPTVAAEKMRVDFVANASHELRTPLATIMGYAETLADEPEIENELRTRFGGVIREEAKRMLRIVEDLMSLSRIEAERFVVPTERVDLAGLASSAAQNGRRMGQDKAVQIDLDIDPSLPPVLGDPGQLAQLLDNLVVNAIRYGCVGENCSVSISVKLDRGYVDVRVADNGIGIPREHLHRLTERFYRVDAARSRDSGGTGLGLSIVRHIVERHRGTLEINSEVGVGTEVTVRLPVAVAANPPGR
jgi:two-component system, OmpR family, phosphate regulon sensor histidine kinase PhoR